MGADYGRQLQKLLSEAGCYFQRAGKGSHQIWYSPISRRSFTVVCNCKTRHTANQILKDAGLDKAF